MCWFQGFQALRSSPFIFLSYKIQLLLVVDGTSRYWRLIYLLKFITSYILGTVPSLYWGGFTNKESHRAPKQRETDHERHKATRRFCGTLNYNRGRSRHKQSCSFSCCLSMLFVRTWYFFFFALPEYSGEQLGVQLSAVCSVTPLKLHRFPRSLEKRRGAVSWSPLFRVNKALI